MDVGLTMSTHGLLRRDERDFFLQRLDASELFELVERSADEVLPAAQEIEAPVLA